MSNENTQTPLADHSADFRFALGAQSAKLEALEKRLDGGKLSARVQKIGSLVALVIGIFLSVVSIFDIFLIKPKDNLIRDIEDFNRAVNAVASLRQQMVQLQFGAAPNPPLLQAAHSAVMPQVLANIHTATAILPKLGDNVGIPQLIVLISEAMNIYDWESARLLVDRAVSVKNAAPTMQSEAYRYKARMLFQTGSVQDGRKAYEDSLKAIRNEPGFGIDAARAYIVQDWIIAEYGLGDCGIGNERVRQFLTLVQQPQIVAIARAGLIASLKYHLAQLQWQSSKRCAIPQELSDLT